jgi:hypothetical protein
MNTATHRKGKGLAQGLLSKTEVKHRSREPFLGANTVLQIT